MSKHSKVDVVVVGAGPAGLMAAVLFAKLNVSVRIIDRRVQGENAGQADGIQPRMVEIWDTLGLGAELRNRGTHVHRLVMYAPNDTRDGIKTQAQTINIPLPSARYPHEVLAPINITEGIMTRTLAQHGITIEMPMIPTEMSVSEDTEQEYPIKLSIAKLKEDFVRSVPQEDRNVLATNPAAVEYVENIDAKYVIGCDGGKSWVRRAVGITMEGNQTELDWGVIDFTPDTNIPTPRAKNIVQSPISGALGYLPRPGETARIYVLFGKARFENTPEDPTNQIVEAIENGFKPYRMIPTKITWASIYRVSQRIASAFAFKNRVFIAGDACHVHSPKGGQGANASMTDTYNLAWKIAYALRGWSQVRLLETYEEERRPHGVALIDFDREIFKLFNPEGVTPKEYTELWQKQIMFTSGLDVKYSSWLCDQRFNDVGHCKLFGERFPPVQVLRIADWVPVNTLDLIIFNGKFKIFYLAGDTTQENTVADLNSFAEVVSQSDKLPSWFSQATESFVVFSNHAQTVAMEIDLPLTTLRVSVNNVFASPMQEAELYSHFGLEPSSVALMLVRPDGHISAVLPLNAQGGKLLQDYFSML